MSVANEARPPPTHLDAMLDWLWQLLVVRVRELQAEGVLPPPSVAFPGTAVTPEEIEARIQAQAVERVESARARLHAAHAACRAAERANGAPAPLVVLRETFDLSAEAELILLATVAPELRPGFCRLYAYLQNHFERQYATLALVMECQPGGDPDRLRRELDASAPLRQYRLIDVDGSTPSTPASHRALIADPRVVRFIGGDQRLDPALGGVCTIGAAGSRAAPPVLAGDARAAFDRLREQAVAAASCPWELPVIALCGPPGAGRRYLAADLAGAMGAPLLVTDLPAALDGAPAAERMAVLLREARLQQAVLCLTGWEQVSETARAASRVALDRLLIDYAGAVFLVLATGTRVPALRRQTEVLRLGRPDADSAQVLWERFLPATVRAPSLRPADLGERFRLTPGEIRAVSEVARDAAARQGEPVDPTGLVAAVRGRVQHRLGEVATRVEPRYRLDDLIVDDEARLQLRELISRHRHRGRVLREWGLGRRFGATLGVSALFDGPPGTGKTMAASIVARELGLDLYQIDLSKVVDRYVGETEKNLARVFDEAEHAQAMLLFDEADSLFAQRTSVQSSNDRYANLEVNFLLQRLESFGGLAILTTNFPASIDDAFIRRLSLRVSFAAPEPEERARLWTSMLGAGTLPLASDVDPERLAEEFDLTGGYIRNAVLRAAFIAAELEGPVTQHLLRTACRIELRTQGKLVEGRPHGDLWNA